MLLSDIREWIRGQTEVDADDVSDAALNVLVNQYYDLINGHQDWPYLEATADLVLPTTGTVALPADFGALRSQQRVLISGVYTILRERNIEELDRYTRSSPGSSTPQFFAVEAGSIITYPAPPASCTLKLRYYKRPKVLADVADANSDTTPIFDRRFHTLPGQGALIKVYERLDQFNEARIAKQDFDEHLARMDQFYLRARQRVVFGEDYMQYGRRWDEGDPPLPFESWA